MSTKGSDSREFFEIYKTSQKKAEDVENKVIKTHPESPDINQQQKTPGSEESPDLKPTVIADPLEWIKHTAGRNTPSKDTFEMPAQPAAAPHKSEKILRKDEVVLRQETLIIGAIAATFLSIACFFVGHKVGFNKGKSNQAEEWQETIEPQGSEKTGFGQSKPIEQSQKPVNKETVTKEEKQHVEQPKTIIKDKWTLRVVSYKNTKEFVEKAKVTARIIQDTLGYNAFVVNTGKDIFICVGEFESSDSSDLIKTQKALAEFKYENKKQFSGCYPVRVR